MQSEPLYKNDEGSGETAHIKGNDPEPEDRNNNTSRGLWSIRHCILYRVLLHWAKGVLQAEFDIMRIRDHLHNCIENMELMPFPKLRRKLKLRKLKKCLIILYSSRLCSFV